MKSFSLKTKFLMGVIGIVLLLGLAMVLFVRIVLYERLYANLEKRGGFIANKTAQDSIDPILTEKLFMLQLLVKDLKRSEKDIEYIFIQGPDGRILAHTFANGFPEDLRSLNGNSRSGKIQRLASERGDILDFPAPLLGGTIGWLHLGMSEQPVREGVNEVIVFMGWIIVAVLVLGSALAVVLATSITKPIHLLAIAAQSLESGNLNSRVPVRSGSEVGQLEKAFNNMAETQMRFVDRLSASEKKLRDITSHLAEGLYVMDEKGVITFMNPEAERLLGWTVDELNAVGAHSLIHNRKPNGTSLPLEACSMHSLIRTGERFVSTDEMFVRKDGTVFPVAVVSSPIIENDRVVASVTAFHDISDQKELERDRDQLILSYQDALESVKTLKGLIPICSVCKKIRNDSGYWSQIEAYVSEHSEAEFSHGICPECAERIYPGLYKEPKKST